MRTNLAIMVYPARGSRPLWFYVPGQTILQEVSDAVARFEMQATKLPSGVFGTETKPLVLRNASNWMTAFVSMRNFRNSAYYFDVANRVIKKWPDGSHGGHADGFYMSDNVLSGTDPVRRGEDRRVWTRDNGASYREFARFMAKCMPSGNELGWSEDIADKMRIVLAGGKNLSGAQSSSIFSALPLLCAVMFLAESGRNKRAWPVGLMLLDSIGMQYNVVTKTNPAKYYTWDRVLAHPERIDSGYKGSAPLSKPQSGPTRFSRGDKGTPLGLGPLSKKEDLVKVEGKLPASPKGSASTGSTIDVVNDYIQMKEVSLVIRWLQRVLAQVHQDDSDVEFVTWRDSDPLDGLTNLMSDTALRQMITKPPVSTLGITLHMLQQTRASVLGEIRDVLNKRCTTFAKM